MKKEDNQKFDEKKVLEIKKRIKEGTFKINAEFIANKIINEVGKEYLLKNKNEMH